MADRSRTLTCLLAATACLLALVIAPTLAAAKVVKQPKAQEISLLYALNADAGTLTPRKGKGAMYKLTLKGLDHSVTWFSDRPARRSSSFAVTGLPEAWKGFGFAADPPNAALTYIEEGGSSPRTVIVELSHPRYAKGRLSFAVRVLDPKRVKNPNLAEHAASADGNPSRRLSDASLFIDDSEAPVVKGCILQPHTTCVGVNLELAGSLQGHQFLLDLQGSDFSQSSFADAYFTETNFEEAKLTGTSFEQAGMLSTNFKGADLRGAILDHGLFEGASFEEANLTGASYAGGNFFYARFTKAEANIGRLMYEGGLLCHTLMEDGLEAMEDCPT